MVDKEQAKIVSLGLDEAMDDLKVLAQRVSEMSKDLLDKASEQAEGASDKIEDLVNSTGDVLISAGETIKSVKQENSTCTYWMPHNPRIFSLIWKYI